MRNNNVLMIMSPKGGAGKTVTTANLAAALSTYYGKKILAVDTNVTTASLGYHLNLLYPEFTIQDLLRKGFSIDKAIYNYSQNLHVIPATILIEKSDKTPLKIEERIQKLSSHYEEFLSKLSPYYDLVLLDSAPGFGIETLAAMQVSQGVLLITNPELPALAATMMSVEYTKLTKIPTMGIVLNKVTRRRYELGKDEIEKSTGVTVLEEIPFDKKIPESISQKIPVTLYSPNSRSGLAYRRLAAQLIGENIDKRGFFLKLMNYFK
ncbi:AAA family ATPase [Candidatus Woesearchaeota archaeon]|nr:AAA family ATPase [Candidatus Woesearchaeota archaeon]